MTLIPLTPEIARAVAWDTANRRMRKAGRKRWNKSDLAAATAEYLRLLELCNPELFETGGTEK